VAPPPTAAVHSKIDQRPNKIGILIFAVLMAIGFIYSLWHLIADVSRVQRPSTFAFLLLGVALLVALGFEFVNGFHDTANAVATVIYTHSLDPHIAVAWWGIFNFLGVVLSSGAQWRTPLSPCCRWNWSCKWAVGRVLRWSSRC
jgi:PiT family inorganic phosphate transporter